MVAGDKKREKKTAVQLLCLLFSYSVFVFGVLTSAFFCYCILIVGIGTFWSGMGLAELVITIVLLWCITLFCVACHLTLFWLLHKVHKCKGQYLFFKITTCIIYTLVMCMQLGLSVMYYMCH